jgi:WD40-like Beta Propeller Repeat
VNVGPTINTTAAELLPAFSRDGHWMFFASDRTTVGARGGMDIWASWRSDIHDDFDWQAPVNLGSGVNSSANENGVGYFANDGRAPQLYFGSDRGGAPGNADLYVSTLSRTEHGDQRPSPQG